MIPKINVCLTLHRAVGLLQSGTDTFVLCFKDGSNRVYKIRKAYGRLFTDSSDAGAAMFSGPGIEKEIPIEFAYAAYED